MTLFAALVGHGLAAATEGAPPFVAIKQGVAGPYKWQVFTRRDTSPLGNKYNPCLGVGFSGKNDPGETHVKIFYLCRVVKPTPNMIVDSVGSGKNLRTVIAMAYDRRVQRSLIDLGSRGVRHLHLSLLSKELARKVHLAQYRYSALELAGHFCIHRIAGFTGAGNVVADDEHVTCF